MRTKILCILGSLLSMVCLSQENDSIVFKNGIDNPSLLTTHHFGIFSSRINTNFKLQSPQKTTFTFNHISGNTFHPYVEAYFPKDPTVREQLSHIIWHDRPFNFIDQETTPADYMNIVVDAVIKAFRVGISIPLSKTHELDIQLRSYVITKGTYPFSIFTGDEIIEFFHSHIAGGEDPYGRKYYGFDQVHFEYLDRNGNTLQLNNNDFFIGGIELNHFYYPKLKMNKNAHVFLNFGTHLGLNTSKYNTAVDLGVSANAVKQIPLKNNLEFNVAVGANVLRKNVINFKEVMDLGNNPYLATLEGNLELVRFTKRKNYNAFGVNYQIQSRYNKKVEADYYKLLGKWREINGGWQHGVETLYKALSNWSFIYTYGTPKLQLSLYIKEDFVVNNAPDLQTGIGLKVPVFK
ncbi:hypothetical protein [Gaetbulibacter aestuarii]|uniref:Phosphate-selective porin O/P n=1 Tax=Gaetbulibacter aestuarii TaxID=1502358 RepID=A0ABW7MV02_9FLAO